MRKKSQAASEQKKEASQRKPTFLLELPLQVSVGQAACLRAHLEAGRQFYNAVLSRSDSSGCGPCGLIQSGKSPVPFHTLRNRSEPEHLRRCASSMGFLSTPCTKPANDFE
jgi:hypothetical protein